MSQQYSIRFTNNSTNAGSACIFQKNHGNLPHNTFSLAWLTRYCNPGMQSNFSWVIEYSFVWGATGMLKPGLTFNASQMVAAGLTSNNQIALNYNNGSFMLEGQGTGSPAGSLYINETASIPMNTASVGIGMSGAGTFVTQAQPNMRLAFSPQPTYCVAFGNFNPGQVLNTNGMGNSAQVTFPANVYTMYVVLNPDNSWSISPSRM